MSLSTLLVLLDLFSELSAEWLLRGEGNMLRIATSNDTSASSDDKVKDVAYWKHVALSMSEEVTEKKDRIKELERELQRLGEKGSIRQRFQDCLGKRHRSCCITSKRPYHIGSFSCYNKTIHHISLMKQKTSSLSDLIHPIEVSADEQEEVKVYPYGKLVPYRRVGNKVYVRYIRI